MSDRQSYRTELNDLLRAEYTCAGRLNTLLGAEAKALITRDVEAMERLLDEKQGLIQQLEHLENRMRQLLQSAGFGTQPRDVEACLAWCDDSGQLIKGWRLLMERIRNAQQQNRINGATLESSRRYTQQTLALLRGQVPESDLYNPTGNTGSYALAGRSLAKA